MYIKRLIWCALLGILLLPAIARAQDEVVYYHTDAIGSVRAMTDDTGAVIHRYDFLPFGEAWDPPPNSDTRQFAGKERDRETGLDVDYFGARYHLPVIGRFTTVDPVMNIDAALTDPQRWNRYSYAANRPFTMVDADGRNPVYLSMLFQRLASSPAGQRAQQFGQQAYIWATRFFSSPAGQEITEAAAASIAGHSGPSATVTGNLGRLARAEVETGLRLAQKLGQSIRVSDHVGAEFVSAAGKTFDAMGTPQAYTNWNQSQFMAAIDRHLLKSVDFTVIDLTGANMSQIGAIRKHVGALQKELKDKIVFVGEYF